MIQALNNNDSNAYFEAVRKQEGYVSLGSAALDLAIDGVTSISEAKKVLGQLTEIK